MKSATIAALLGLTTADNKSDVGKWYIP